MAHELSDHEAYDLFRRAIVEGSQDAWALLYTQYRAMMLGWVHHHYNATYLSDSPEEIADRAFTRAWTALRDGRNFGQFQTAASLLAYLRNCVHTAVIDEMRTTKARERMRHQLKMPMLETPEEQVLRETLCKEVWNVLAVQPLSKAERVVIACTFVDCQPPRQILHEHPDLFDRIEQIYTIKRNLFQRLLRCQSLRQLYEQLSA